jgi:carboxypeptidase family protein
MRKRRTATMLVGSLVMLALMLAPSGVFAQTGGGTFGTVLGTVNDESGAVVPKATVTATNEKTGVGRSGTTNSEGSYQIPALLPGSYRVEAEASGFKKYRQGGVILRVN